MKNFNLSASIKSLAIIVICSLFIFTSCEEPVISGVETPSEDDFNFAKVDTFTVIATTVKEKDLKLRGDAPYNGLLGNINDNVFGNLTSSVYIQFRPADSDINKEFANHTIDSVVLFINYNQNTRFYGCSQITPFNIIVNEVNSLISYKDTFKIEQSFNVHNLELFNSNILPNIKEDSTKHGGTTYKYPILILKLNNSIGTKLLTTSPDFKDKDKFLTYFNGLKISATPVNASDTGGFFILNVRNSNNKIRVYYKIGSVDSLYTDYFVKENCAAMNSVNINNYQNANAYYNEQINKPDSIVKNDSIIFIQGFGKSKSRIHIPYFKNFIKKGIVIHKARLVIPLSESYYSNYTSSFINKITPGFLNLTGIDGNGNEFKLNDFVYPTNNYFGGYHNKGEYFFNITRYLQSIINNPSKSFNGFYLYNFYREKEPNKVILNGGNKKIGNRMRLEVSYTII